MNEIAKDLIVLDAISNGINQFDKIVKVTKKIRLRNKN